MKNIIFCYILSALMFASCVSDQDWGSEGGEGLPVAITLGTVTRATGDLLSSENEKDYTLSTLRVLGYHTSNGVLAFNKLVTSDKFTETESGTKEVKRKAEVNIITGNFTFVFIGNETSDGSLHTILQDDTQVFTLAKLKELTFKREAFDKDKAIPMFTAFDNVLVKGDNTLIVDGDPVSGIWPVPLNRVGVRLDLTLTLDATQSTQWDAFCSGGNSFITLGGVPQEAFLFPATNNSVSRVDENLEAVDPADPAIPGIITENSGNYIIKYQRIIIPELLFKDSDDPGQALTIRITLKEGGGNKTYSGKIGVDIKDDDSEKSDYTLPRNYCFKLTGTIQKALEYSAEVMDWDQALQNTIIDKQYFLDVSESKVTFNHFGGFGLNTSAEEYVFTATTDYDADDRGFDPGIYITHNSPEWLDILIDNEGTLEAKVKVRPNSRNMPDFGEGEAIDGTLPDKVPENRKAVISISAGNMTKTISVTQEYAITPFFARSNIVMKDGRLKFAVTAADNGVIPANTQGIFFKWGSLVGISGEGVRNNEWDANYVIFTPPESSYTKGNWDEIPYYKGKANNSDMSRDYYMELFPPKGYKAEDALGDICRYISGRDVEGHWRTPTMDELILLIAESPKPTRFGTYQQKTVTASGGNNYGLYQMDSGTLMGIGHTPQDGADNIEKPANGRIFLPASGFRHPSEYGPLWDANQFTYYWSSTLGPRYGTDDRAFALEIDCYPQWNDGAIGINHERFGGYPVRCIRE